MDFRCPGRTRPADLCRALISLFSNKLIAESLAFRGGTALHKLFLKPPSRYSEDIDLVQTKAGAIGPVIDAVRDTLDGLLGAPKRERGEDSAHWLGFQEYPAAQLSRLYRQVETE